MPSDLVEGVAEVVRQRDQYRAQLEWVKAAIEQNGDPRTRDDFTQHRLSAAVAEIYAGVCQVLYEPGERAQAPAEQGEVQRGD